MVDNQDLDFDEEFKNLEKTLTQFRTQITSFQQKLRALDKNVARELKRLNKEVRKNKNRGNRKPSGFAKPSKISDELCDFMGRKRGSKVARTDVTRFIIRYIKENDLSESKFIKPDEELGQILGVRDNVDVTFFNIQKFMNKHFI